MEVMLTFVNYKESSIVIKKYIEGTTLPLEGATFEVINQIALGSGFLPDGNVEQFLVRIAVVGALVAQEALVNSCRNTAGPIVPVGQSASAK